MDYERSYAREEATAAHSWPNRKRVLCGHFSRIFRRARRPKESNSAGKFSDTADTDRLLDPDLGRQKEHVVLTVAHR